MKRFTAVSAVVVAVVVAMLLFGIAAPPVTVSAQNTACYRPVGGASFECGDGGSFVVQDGATLLVESGGTLTAESGSTTAISGLQVNGNGVVTGTLTASGNLIAATTANYTPQGILTVTSAGVITPTGTLQLLTAAGGVTASLAPGSAGQMVILLNTAAQTITIEDTTGQLLSGNIALAQWDVATLVYYGTSWIQVSESDN